MEAVEAQNNVPKALYLTFFLVWQAVSSEKETCEKALKEAENQRQQLDASLKTSSDRCEELLEELNQMNKALRERGEKISRLEAAHQEKSQELETTTTCLKELQSKVRVLCGDCVCVWRQKGRMVCLLTYLQLAHMLRWPTCLLILAREGNSCCYCI